jgi:AcrR family transcriptional regulator
MLKTYLPVGILCMYTKSTTTIANILEEAKKLFVNRNYADVTMLDIAEAAEVTKGALYYHFASKEALYVGMMLAYLQEVQVLLRSAVESDGACRERLHYLTLNFLNLSHEERSVMQLVRRDINIFKDPIRNKLIRAYQAALPEQVEAIIRDGIRDGEVIDIDPRLLAWEYAAIVEVVLSSRYAQRVLGNHNQQVDCVLNLFFNGVKATEA